MPREVLAYVSAQMRPPSVIVQVKFFSVKPFVREVSTWSVYSAIIRPVGSCPIVRDLLIQPRITHCTYLSVTSSRIATTVGVRILPVA